MKLIDYSVSPAPLKDKTLPSRARGLLPSAPLDIGESSSAKNSPSKLIDYSVSPAPLLSRERSEHRRRLPSRQILAGLLPSAPLDVDFSTQQPSAMTTTEEVSVSSKKALQFKVKGQHQPKSSALVSKQEQHQCCQRSIRQTTKRQRDERRSFHDRSSSGCAATSKDHSWTRAMPRRSVSEHVGTTVGRRRNTVAVELYNTRSPLSKKETLQLAGASITSRSPPLRHNSFHVPLKRSVCMARAATAAAAASTTERQQQQPSQVVVTTPNLPAAEEISSRWRADGCLSFNQQEEDGYRMIRDLYDELRQLQGGEATTTTTTTASRANAATPVAASKQAVVVVRSNSLRNLTSSKLLQTAPRRG